MSKLNNGSLPTIVFNKNSKIFGWKVVNDVVMGGQSNGQFCINNQGHAVFYGAVSIANNGGFSLVRHRFDKLNVSNFELVKIHLKGDGKKYQFRLKPNKFNQVSYTIAFQTSKEWETIEVKLGDLIPTFRGKTLDVGNYDGNELEEIGFLIGNKKDEDFQLLIDSIVLE